LFVRIKRTKPEQLYVYSTKNKSGGGTSFSPSVVESHDMNNKGKGKANKTSLKGSKCKCQQPKDFAIKGFTETTHVKNQNIDSFIII
jgi:hypothetical protein